MDLGFNLELELVGICVWIWDLILNWNWLGFAYGFGICFSVSSWIEVGLVELMLSLVLRAANCSLICPKRFLNFVPCLELFCHVLAPWLLDQLKLLLGTIKPVDHKITSSSLLSYNFIHNTPQ